MKTLIKEVMPNEGEDHMHIYLESLILIYLIFVSLPYVLWSLLTGCDFDCLHLILKFIIDFPSLLWCLPIAILAFLCGFNFWLLTVWSGALYCLNYHEVPAVYSLVGLIFINRIDNCWRCSLWKCWCWYQSLMAIRRFEIPSPCLPKNSGSGTIRSSADEGCIFS